MKRWKVPVRVVYEIEVTVDAPNDLDASEAAEAIVEDAAADSLIMDDLEFLYSGVEITDAPEEVE